MPDFVLILLVIFVISTVILAFLFYFLFKKQVVLKQELQELEFSKQSQSVKYGRLSEQWIPLSQEFPFNPESFRFLGSPIDGIAFEDNKIIFCEFKAANSVLSEKQKRVKELIRNGQVEWFEMKLK